MVVARIEPTVTCEVVPTKRVPSKKSRVFEGRVVWFVPPLAIERVPVIVESVVVATHDGAPLARESTKPSVVEATRVKVEAEFA